MDNKMKSMFEQSFESALKSHPLFAAMEPEQLAEVADSFNATFEALFKPRSDALSAWVQYQTDFAKLWLGSFAGNGDKAPARTKDRRFSDDAWNEGMFSFWRDAYCLTAERMTDIADKTGLPSHEQRKLSFYTRLIADALAPSNYALTNPEIIRRAKETKGQSLIDGFRNLLADVEKGYISTTDEDAFDVGRNLATTEGSVVYRNELIELIQYHPVTPTVEARPVLVVPPCVNKFYIFDINEKKSMVRYMLEQGLSVYMISWRNPSPERDFGWDTYIETGVFQALSVCLDISGADKVDLLSWCNGGTMLTVALAVMDDALKRRIGTATFLSSMIDFSDPGELEVFIDRPQIEIYKQRLRTEKLAPGRDIAHAMSLLHVNDSIWNFVVGSYLLGKSPPPFDILYWNADTSNLPAKWFSYYIEKMYHENRLKDPGSLEILGQPVDTGRIDIPCYFVAATGDHIVPWKTSYLATGLVGGQSEYVLTDGGHVSGTVVNHPTKSRRNYHHGGDRKLDPEGWKASAEHAEGSWWPHWIAWLAENGTEKRVASPKAAGSDAYPVLGPAPGTYVTEAVSTAG